eukprot:m.235441 g.235441  ORF g.235441 m.235441 type:complete len:409 (+) comp19337_c0_seq1:118-1344(+)
MSRQPVRSALYCVLLAAISGGASPELNVVQYQKESDFGVVEVIDYDLRPDDDTPGLRLLRCGDAIVGADFLAKDEYGIDQSAFLNFAIHQAVVYRDPKPERVLQLGLGAGTVPTFLRIQNIAVDVVEISSEVVEAAEIYFDYVRITNDSRGTLRQGLENEPLPDGSVNLGLTFLSDAVQFLDDGLRKNGLTNQYDVVMHDLFNGDNPSWTLNSRVFAVIRDNWLTSEGLFLLNFMGFHPPDREKDAQLADEMLHLVSPTVAVYQSLKSVFRAVRCFREVPPDMLPDKPANLIFLASASTQLLDDREPFPTPTDGDYKDPPKLSPFWAQKYFHTFEITERLEDALMLGGIMELDDAYTDEVHTALSDGYHELLLGIYPPAQYWSHVVDVGGRALENVHSPEDTPAREEL